MILIVAMYVGTSNTFCTCMCMPLHMRTSTYVCIAYYSGASANDIFFTASNDLQNTHDVMLSSGSCA